MFQTERATRADHSIRAATIFRMRNLPLLCVMVSAACSSSNSVDSNEQARRAYLGLDNSISKSLELAFQGYDAATNANIPTQTAMGDAMPGGTLTITGKVDSGNCSQLSMGLDVGLVKYTDGPFVVDAKNNTKISVTYDTNTDVTMQPLLSIKLNGSSGNAINATLMGDYTMTGDLKGTVTLDLTITGTFSGTCPNAVMRVPGSTTVTGNAVNSSGGMYAVNVTI
jgi:hypothetical protein